VLRAAIELADDGGIEALSMRKLARELGVEAMSLYNHVRNKSDLVEAMVDLVVGEIELPDEPDWERAIRRCAISAYDTYLRHPWACSLVMAPGNIRLEQNPRLRYMEWLLGRLVEAGFSPELTYRGYHALDSHILGFTMWYLGHSAGRDDVTAGEDPEEFVAKLVPQLRAGGYPRIAEHAEQHVSAPWRESLREFEFGLDLILDGLKQAL
jgi:AcrR family transcriptional regulator